MAASIDDLPTCNWCGHDEKVPGCPGIIDLDDDFSDGEEFFDDDDAYWDDDLPGSEDYSPPPHRPYGVPVDHATLDRSAADRFGGGAR